MKKYGQKGITILALVVTIIILLILAGITLSTVTSDSGILGRAKNAANIWRDSAKKENVVLNNYQNAIASAINDVKKPKIDETKSYVGYYADINDDGKVEGIIYADMATDMKGNGTWGNSSYTIPKKTNLRNYYIENQSYTGNFRTAPVVAPNGSGENRFYVMALKDIDDKQNGTFLGWYNGAYSNGINEYAKITSTGFETGKTNTQTMITKWNAKAYGEKDAYAPIDIWGQIQENAKNGWFVPSKEEWTAFAGELGMSHYGSEKYYYDFGISHYYWTSSLYSAKEAWIMRFDDMKLNNSSLDIGRCVRLSTIF